MRLTAYVLTLCCISFSFLSAEVPDKNNQTPVVKYNEAYALYKQKKIKEALKAFEETAKAAEEFQNDDIKNKTKKIIPKLYVVLASSLLKERNYEESIVNYQKAVEIDPDNASAYLGLATIYKKTKNTDKLVEALSTIEGLNNEKVKYRSRKLGYAYFVSKGTKESGAKKYTAAEASLKNALRFGGENANTYYQLTKVYNGMKYYDKAVKAGKTAVGLENGSDEKKAKLYYELALAYYRKGDKTNACESYKKAAVGKYTESADYQIKHVLKCK